MRLTVLGCCGTYAAPGGACSGYLVSTEGTTLWIDAGSGTLANLQRHVAPGDIDAVVLSHEHPDHWTDVEGFFYATRFAGRRSGPAPSGDADSRQRPRGVPVYAPAGLRRRTYEDHAPHLAWNDVAEGDEVVVGRLRLRFSRTDHGPETLAVRVDGPGASLGYSADTGPGWSLEALGPGLDLALCEATFQRPQEGSARHLSARQAGASARDAGARRLVLTHVWPTMDRERTRAEGSEAYGGVADLAETNETYDVTLRPSEPK